MKPVRLLLRLVAAATALGFTALGPVAAADDQVVYRPLVTDQAEYRRISYPLEAGSILILADTVVILEAVKAPVFYWPITREYLVDLSNQPPPIEGKFEIVDAAQKATVIDPQSYIVSHPEGVGTGPAELIHGDRVAAFYADYVEKARTAAAQSQAYQRIVAQHQAAVEAWLKIAAERPEQLPPPPPELTITEPVPYRAFATEPVQGFVVSLPEGRYRVRMRDGDGNVIPGSERDLVSFGALREGIGYVVRLEDRWTQPLLSFAPGDTVYTTGQADLFLQHVPVAQYEAQRYARLLSPQSVEVADADETVWVPRSASPVSDEVALALRDDGELISTVPTRPYRVAQVPGASRGYRIEEFAPEQGSPLQPDFLAMRVGRDVPLSSVDLVRQPGNEPTPGSERRIKRVAPVSAQWLFLPVLVPLALAGIGAAVRRSGRFTRG